MEIESGILFQINVSTGGVPKLPIRKGDVTPLGLQTDTQRNKKYHGGPDRALCLFSLERIQQLQEEGHPIYPGAIGENLTISGLAWAQLKEGTRLRVGKQVELEVTAFAVPCRNIRESFIEHKFGRVSQKSNPGWARLYTRVLQTGQIQVGDSVVVLG